MGKKKNKKKSKIDVNLPNVSICTPTFNRRPFFEGLIQCIKAQDYPHEKIEWIILDDGTDKIEDLINNEITKENLKNMKIIYCHNKEKLDLGKKRNIMHKLCKFQDDEDIIVYMDDDDYYPPERVSHSVERLVKNKHALCGGSSELLLWFNVLDQMYKFGPYGPNHATAGTFAFKRKLLNQTSYEDDAVLAEEKHFLKNYTIPFVQFDPNKTILVVSHEQNTFDKKKLVNEKNKFCKKSDTKVEDIIKNKELLHFYKTKINDLLKDYLPGDVKNKPKVLKEIQRREAEMKKISDENRKCGISVKTKENKIHELSVKECKEYMTNITNECINIKKEYSKLISNLNNLKNENDKLKIENESLKNENENSH